jgi:N-glycosylase/DNA lyase
MPRPAITPRPLAASGRAFRAANYDLAATLDSGQAFRWQPLGDAWEGVIAGRWVRLTLLPRGLRAELAEPSGDWRWLTHYLRLDEDLDAVLAAFPPDPPLLAATRACAGLRLLRQEPWECLASFLLSSSKQIVQIRQIVALLCERFGEPVAVPTGHAPAFAFPTPGRIAACSEAELRACKMGFRARYLRETARLVADGKINLVALAGCSLSEARARLMALPGIGPKIADCVLLFTCGFERAFPVDVWVARVLRQLYFPGRRVTLRALRAFSENHFGPRAGYAQQYLFHYMRTRRLNLER